MLVDIYPRHIPTGSSSNSRFQVHIPACTLNLSINVVEEKLGPSGAPRICELVVTHKISNVRAPDRWCLEMSSNVSLSIQTFARAFSDSLRAACTMFSFWIKWQESSIRLRSLLTSAWYPLRLSSAVFLAPNVRIPDEQTRNCCMC